MALCAILLNIMLEDEDFCNMCIVEENLCELTGHEAKKSVHSQHDRITTRQRLLWHEDTQQ